MDSHIDSRGHDLLDDFECSEFGHADLSYDVYRSGSGPAVIVMPEIPGITHRSPISPGSCVTEVSASMFHRCSELRANPEASGTC